MACPPRPESPAARWGALQKPDIEALLGTRPVAKTDHFVLHCVSRPVVASELSTEAAPDRDASVDISVPAGPEALVCGFAAVIPKRHARRSVTRNLIRRQMREAVRLQSRIAPGSRVLIRLRAPFDPRRFASAASLPLRQAVRAELDLLLARPGVGAAA